MSLAYLFDPNNQFQDRNGVNNVAGFLRVFLNGTDDRARTYKNFNGTFNPADIPLDNDGRAVVIVENEKTYRIEVYSRNGNLLWSQYPVQPSYLTINYGEYNTYTMDADIYGTLDEIDVDIEKNPTTGFKNFYIKLASAVKNTITNLVNNVTTLFTNLNAEITRAQNAESGLSERITYEAHRATEAESALSESILTEMQRAEAGELAARTEVRAGENIDIDYATDPQDGHRIYTVNGVESVPRVNIISSGNTIQVSSSENPQTNTKTFDIDVKHNPLSVGWFQSLGNMSYESGALRTENFRLGLYNTIKGDKITIDNTSHHVSLKAGMYAIDTRYVVSWTGDPVNEFIYVGGHSFDLSYNHREEISSSLTMKLESNLAAYKNSLSFSEDSIPEGLVVSIGYMNIRSLEQVLENVVQGLQSVSHDTTMTGDGTSEHPLGVVVDNELDDESTNPISNAAVYAAVGDVASLLADL